MNDWRPFVYGGLSSVIAECGTFPIDTSKTRLQIQGQKLNVKHTELKYRGMFHAIYRIGSEEGVKALYSGLKPAVLRQATYGTIKIGIYHTLKRAICKDPKDEKLLPNMVCGVIAGIVSSCIANPTDVLKVRFQAQNESFKKMGLIQAFGHIYRNEGVRGLWRGVGPTANRAAIVVGVELPAYDITKKHIINHGLLGDNMYTHFISSFIAGLLGAICSNPVDVVKTRLMNQQNLMKTTSQGASPAIYTSSLHCMTHTVRTEGVAALYKGFIPNWVRLGPWNIIFFITYEQMKRLNL
ncbi:unnamed protein product [Owenia fusiformis]|uniref:Uncharacterized protein n=1 Tax=Owenia fusiformis TaxID=6347 RepID=A0A8J1UG14_OWEFU|nr:unnamed protein product [Owenia fusiformis]